jgi:predicted RNA-binding protein YlxR (DUF448 family)
VQAARRPPTRSCIACRTSREKRELLRVVRSPDGTVTFDPKGRANGRGAYVCRDAACIATALGRGTLARTLETPIPAALRAELDAAAAMNEHDMGGGPRGQE